MTSFMILHDIYRLIFMCWKTWPITVYSRMDKTSCFYLLHLAKDGSLTICSMWIIFFCRISEDCHGNSNWFWNYGIYWIFCKIDTHPNQQHYCVSNIKLLYCVFRVELKRGIILGGKGHNSWNIVWNAIHIYIHL
jgi:hypothetical protein